MNINDNLTSLEITELFGSCDKNIKMIEEATKCEIIARDNEIKIIGEKSTDCKNILSALLSLIRKKVTLDEQKVKSVIEEYKSNNIEEYKNIYDELIGVTASGTPIKPKTIGQKNYTRAIKDNIITIGIGPAGTGKTYLAVAMAVSAFKKKEVNRIILTRPAVEAGESLGFLPGDLQEKIDPYLRPLYDALFEMLGGESFNAYREKGLIEVAPLAYMRGRTLDNSFIILDEAQNTTKEQMKMFLTRIGFNSKAVITGDITQIDLPGGKTSGLKDATKILKGIEDIGIYNLSEKDVVRHPLIQKIIKAYERAEKRK